MIALKIFAALVLIILLGGVGWIVTHLTKIKRELIADEGMPKPAPRATLLVFVAVVFVALSGLLITFLLS